MKNLALAALIVLFLSGGVVLAQQTPTSSQGSVPSLDQATPPFEASNDMLRAYQLTNDSVNRLSSLLAIIAAIFGAFITGLVLFFAFKQILADREISEYRTSLKKQKELFEKQTAMRIQEMEESSARLVKYEKEAKELISKIEEDSEKGRGMSDEVERLKKIVEKMRSEYDFEKGRLSSSVYGSIYDPAISGFYSSARVSLGLGSGICPKCGRSYSEHAYKPIPSFFSTESKAEVICPRHIVSDNDSSAWPGNPPGI